MSGDKHKLLNFWYSFFPEVDNKSVVDKIIYNVTGVEIEKYLEKYQETQEKSYKWIEDFYFSNNDLVKEYKEYRVKFHQKVRWRGFFDPIINKYFKLYHELILRQKNIKDTELFLEKILYGLYSNLVNMSFRVLVLEIQIAKEEGKLIGNDSKERGMYYCNVLLYNEVYLKELYYTYPELIRLLDNKVKQTYDYIEEILNNLSDFNSSYGELVKIVLGQGDTHNHGKSVAVIEFENKKLMYKPRSLVIEKKYGELLKWFENENKNFISIDAGQIWDFGDSGCMEFIQNEECKTISEVQDFYYRMGELLCILYTLNSKDFHCENIIAKGSMPILIDLETLIHSFLTFEDMDNIVTSASKKIGSSVIGVSLLPTLLQNNNTDEAIEVGGIGSGKKQISPYKSQTVESMDSDEIHIIFEKKEVNVAQNYPQYNGKIVGCADYLNDIKEGFKDIYSWILKNKELYYQKIQEIFHKVECRIICKNTNVYVQLHDTGYHPDLLHNSIDREIYLCRLGLVMEQNNEYKNSALYRLEFEDLKRDDIPYFTVDSDEKGFIWHGDQKLKIYKNIKSVMEEIKDKIDKMGDIDLVRQLSLINLSFIGSKLITNIFSNTPIKFVKNTFGKSIHEDLIYNSERIGQACVERSLKVGTDNDRQLTWIGMRGFGDGFYKIVPVGFGIYQGNSGIALFLHKLSQIKEEYSEPARQAIIPVINNLEKELETGTFLEGYGAFTGFMSEIYTVLYLYKKKSTIVSSLNLDDVINRSIEMLRKEMKDNNQVDVLSGIAGVMGVLISGFSIYSEMTKNNTLQFIEDVYGKIKELAIKKDTDAITWFENNDIGYAHGNSGIIVQLYRYYLISGNIEALELIRKAINFERRYVYDSVKKLWIFRESTHYFSWCNGIGGLLLAKTYLIENGYKDSLLRDEITLIIEQLKEFGFGTDSSICHGDVGSIKLLEHAATVLGMDNLKDGCRATMNEFLSIYLKEQWDEIMELEDWGLMAGLTGVGFSILSTSNEVADLLLLQ